jgi:NAD(P)H dehydrogenase (quinone)
MWPSVARSDAAENHDEGVVTMLIVTGGTGYVGGAAIRLLSASSGSGPVVGISRKASYATPVAGSGVSFRFADYNDRSSLFRAFEGATALLFIASDGAAPDVLRQHANVIEAATSSGIEHIVFTSIIDVEKSSPFYFTPVYRDAELRLINCGINWTILRCGLYSDFLLSSWIEPARLSGVINVPAGLSRVAPLSRDDVAAAAVAALASPEHWGQIYELTGNQSYSFDEIATLAGKIFGVAIVYKHCSPADYLLNCWATMSEPWPHAYSTMLSSISQGRFASTSSKFEDLTGRAPETLQAFLARKAK